MTKTDNFLSNNDIDSDEINLSSLFSTLVREKKLIFLIVFFTTLSTIIYTFVTKPIWKGSFNIIVKQDQNNVSSILGKVPGDLLGIDLGSQSENKTQRLILKSPSVLMPVFEYVKKEYKKKGIKTQAMSFKEWVKSDLIIDFAKKTSVLSVEYKNKDRDLIINTLDLISSKYKDYAKIKTEKNITRTIEYLESQTKLMSGKYLISSKAFNKFSVENGLGNIDGFVGLGKTNNPLDIQNNLNEASLNKILNSVSSMPNLSQISNMQDTQQDANAGQRYKIQFSNLENYEATYVDLSSKLKPNSKYLKELKLKIDNLRASLKRPNEILLEYKKLSNAATQDEKILKQLENNLALMRLQKIRTPDPWEMISVPTIDDKPFYPIKRQLVGIAFLISLALGSFVGIAKEKLSGIIFDYDIFLRKIPFKFVGNLDSEDFDLNSNLLLKKITQKDKKLNVSLVNLSDNFFINENKIDSIFDNKYFSYKFLNYKNINSYKDLNNIFLIVEPGKITNKNLDKICSYLSIHEEKILGWFYFKK